MTQGYLNSQEHLLDEIRRLDLLLAIQVECTSNNEPAMPDAGQYRGLFLAKEEIDTLLQSFSPVKEAKSFVENKNQKALLAAVEKLRNQINTKTELSLRQGIPLSFPQLRERFNLTSFDADILLLCLAPELDLKYEKLYAYLQNDVTSRRPTVDLAMRLHYATIEEKIQARAAFSVEAPLFRHDLITISSDDQNASRSLLSRSLQIDERIVKYLLEIEIMDEVIAPFTRLVKPDAVLEELLLPPDKKQNLVNLFSSIADSLSAARFAGTKALHFYGPPGVGKKTAAEALCHSAGMEILVTDLGELVANPGLQGITGSLKRLFREARLRGSAIYLDRAEVLTAEQEKFRHFRQLFLNTLESFPGIVFLGSEKPWYSLTPGEAECIASLHFPEPDFNARKKTWQTLIGEGVVAEETIITIADKFQFTAGKIRQAVAEANYYATMRDARSNKVTGEELYRACRSQSTANLSSLAQKLKPLYTWEDIILPADSLRHLKEICLHVKHRQRVFGEWNFDGKISLGKGISALFAGPPGTGKTMAAEVLANDLGLDLYKIDLSSVVSKYIGETEKNLRRVFEEAELSNAILFFDEADALFGRRSEVKDSHDRYANIEINYLLQKMEEYRGIVILASNFQKNIDEAFTRRLRFIIDFPFPDKEYRARIWRGIFPAEMPRNGDIAFDFLAKKFEVSGGHIKNIVLGAAFLAAENSGIVGMKHIVRAAKREFQKMGKLCVRADFDEYFYLLENDGIET